MVQCFARDINPKRAFEALREMYPQQVEVSPAQSRADSFTLYPGTIALIGMSSSPELAEVELEVAGISKTRGRRYGFFSDVRGCYQREWFAPYRENASFLMVCNQDEVSDAKKLFPNALVVATGHPHWEDDAAPARPKGDILSSLGLKKKSKLVVVTGSKTMELNMATLEATMQALAHPMFADMKNVRVVFAPHPGDKNPLETYASAFRNFTMCTREMATSNDLIPSASVYVNILSSAIRRASYFQTGTVCYVDGLIADARRKGNGTEMPEEVKEGTSMLARDPESLAQAIAALLMGNSFQKRRQHLLYPKKAVQRKRDCLQKMMGVMQKAYEKYAASNLPPQNKLTAEKEIGAHNHRE